MLTGRVALVTGAGEGIGLGIAETLADAGAAVTLMARRREPLDAAAARLTAAGHDRVLPFTGDVTDAESLHAAVTATVETFGHLDTLVASAGFSRPGPAYEVSPDDAATMIRTGLLGTFLACQAAATRMRDHGYGKIITLSSTLASTTAPGTAVYSSVKAAVTHLTRALADEWAADGIRVNAIAPTSVETPSRTAFLTPQLRERLLARIPLGRFATMADIAPLARYLAGPESDFVTGQTFHVDGGWTARG